MHPVVFASKSESKICVMTWAKACAVTSISGCSLCSSRGWCWLEGGWNSFSRGSVTPLLTNCSMMAEKNKRASRFFSTGLRFSAMSSVKNRRKEWDERSSWHPTMAKKPLNWSKSCQNKIKRILFEKIVQPNVTSVSHKPRRMSSYTSGLEIRREIL